MSTQWKLMENSISFLDKLKLIKFILLSDKFTNGKFVKKFEEDWNNWLGSKYSLFVSSGSTANFLLLSAIKELYKLNVGDKVLVPACTWTTNVSPIIQLGLHPIFCDIQLKDFSFDFNELHYISKIHPDIKLIFVTHLLGFTSLSRDSDIFNKLFPKALVIDDVCESHGCKSIDGSNIGSNSLGATFSTYFGHHLCSIEGGFVSTNDQKLYDIMKMKRSHGMARESENFNDLAKLYPNIDKQFLFITDGYNFRNTEINAVLGISQLNKLNNSIEIRNNNFLNFCNLTSKYKNVVEEIYFDPTSSNFSFPIVCKNVEIKNTLIRLLKYDNVEYRPIVSGNLLKHPFLKNYNICSELTTHNVNKIHDTGLYVGNNQFINKYHISKLDSILCKL